MDYQELKECLACGKRDLGTYLDLGAQPLANSFHKVEEVLAEYPLAVQLCRGCFHSQLTVAVDPELLFRRYLYVSGTTWTLTRYFSDFADKVERRFGRGSLDVLEIASNDGTLLEEFKKRGHRVQGVDPAENLLPHSKRKGIPTLPEFWGAEAVKKLDRKFDVIVAMNVLAHISNPYEFLQACRLVLREGGVLYIQTSQAEIFRRFEFDTIYHEHHSFFTANSMGVLAERAGLRIVHAEKAPIHGTSYLFSMAYPGTASDDSFERLRRTETGWGFYDPAGYARFAAMVSETARKTRILIDEYRRKGYRVVGYGAAAKGNTFLNYAGLDLDFIIDDNPLKVGLYSPGRNIRVQPMSCLEGNRQDLLVLVLAWNFFEEIRRRLGTIRDNPSDVCFTYFPEVKLSPLQTGVDAAV